MYEKHEFKLITEKIPLYTPPDETNISEKKKQPMYLAWIVGLIIVAYGGWRLFFTLPSVSQYGWIAFVGGIFLLLAELFSSYEALTQHSRRNSAWATSDSATTSMRRRVISTMR